MIKEFSDDKLYKDYYTQIYLPHSDLGNDHETLMMKRKFDESKFREEIDKVDDVLH